MIKLFLIFILFFNLYGFETTFKMYGILKSINNSSNLIFYTHENGNLECRLYGVSGADASKSYQVCLINNKDSIKIRALSRGFAENTLHIEQKYEIGFVGNWCIVKNGAYIYNEQLAKSGYGIIHPNIKVMDELNERIKISKGLALGLKYGLFKEWQKEMRCLQQNNEIK